MAFILIIMPMLMAGLAMVIPSGRVRPVLLPITGTLHLAGTIMLLLVPQLNVNYGWLWLDPLAKVILLAASTLYFFCSFYATGYLKYRQERSNRIFVSCLLGFMGLLSMAVQSHNLGLLWVSMEGTTLIAAPLIYFNRTKLSIEATWKYLMIGSVGIALALLGIFFLAYSAQQGGLVATLSFDDLLAWAPHLSKPWLQAGFILLLVGFGTKLGLAPMHTWKPDTYGESPGVVGAIFSGCVASVAFLALARAWHICQAAGLGDMTSRLLIPMGLFSMLVAGLFMVGQRDIKRMLAYSSVEHMGILALGLGIGRAALFGTLLHVVNNALTKGVTFMSAGNIQRAYGSKNTSQVQGAIRLLPLSGTAFLLGFLAVTGSPPFAPFVSEFSILTGMFATGNYLVAGLFLALLFLVFLGMGRTVLTVVQGPVPPLSQDVSYRDSFFTIGPVLILLALVLILGLFLPPPLRQLVVDAQVWLEVGL